MPGAARHGLVHPADLDTLDLGEQRRVLGPLRRAQPWLLLALRAVHICTGTGLTPRPHLHRDWAQPCPHLRHDSGSRLPTICTGTALTVGFTVGATVDVINDLLLIRVAAFFGIGRGDVAA